MTVKRIVLSVILSAALCSAASSKETVSSKVLAKSCTSWNNDSLPAYPSGTPEVSILRISVPAGTTLPLHHHPVINAGVLVSGELIVITDRKDTLVLHAGDPIVEVVNTVHYGVNTGTEPADIIVFYAGEKDAPITVKEESKEQ